jgi:hypothetical protein
VEEGFRVSSPRVNIVVGGAVGAAVPTLLYSLGTGRTALLKKITAYNGQVADTVLQIGVGATAVAFAPEIPARRCIAGFDNNWDEDELPNHKFVADIYGLPLVQPIQVQLELEIEG